MARGPNRVQADGGAGNDFISARGGFPGTTRPAGDLRVDLLGSTGDDTLVDGARELDELFGAGGNDTLFAVDSQSDDIIGGTRFDRATVDALDLPVTTIEQTTLGTVGKVRLAPAVVHAKAGGVAHMKLSWTHPKAGKRLRRIAVRVSDGGELVQRIVVRPRHAEHHGRTVTARLALRLPRAPAGHRLRVDVEASDRRGRRQLEPSAGLVDL